MNYNSYRCFTSWKITSFFYFDENFSRNSCWLLPRVFTIYCHAYIFFLCIFLLWQMALFNFKILNKTYSLDEPHLCITHTNIHKHTPWFTKILQEFFSTLFMSDFGPKFNLTSFSFEMRVMLTSRWGCNIFLFIFKFLRKVCLKLKLFLI